jgi:hypothetical protein
MEITNVHMISLRYHFDTTLVLFLYIILIPVWYYFDIIITISTPMLIW